MRNDYARLIVEDGSRQGYSMPVKWRKRYPALKSIEDYEDADYGPKKVNVSKHSCRWTRDTKSFGDRLGPLIRCLEQNCGRKWDDVYSEFRSILDVRSMEGYHLLQHIESEVSYGDDNNRWHQFIVDEDGILQRNDSPSWRRGRRLLAYQIPYEHELVVDYIPVDDNFCYKKIDGCWFAVEIYKSKIYRGYPFYELITLEEKKKTLSKKEIKHIMTNLAPKYGCNAAYEKRTYNRRVPISSLMEQMEKENVRPKIAG